MNQIRKTIQAVIAVIGLYLIAARIFRVAVIKSAVYIYALPFPVAVIIVMIINIFRCRACPLQPAQLIIEILCIRPCAVGINLLSGNRIVAVINRPLRTDNRYNASLGIIFFYLSKSFMYILILIFNYGF